MKIRKFAIALGAVGLVGGGFFAYQAALSEDVEAQVEGIPPPLFAGADSQGATTTVQTPDPAHVLLAKAWWPALNIPEPRTAWEFATRGAYRQDDLEDLPGAMADYERAQEMNSHVLQAYARLGTIYLKRGFARAKEGRNAEAIEDLDKAVEEFEEVLHEQPFRQGMNLKIGEAFLARFRMTRTSTDAANTEKYYQAELTLAPQNQRALHDLAFLYRDLSTMTSSTSTLTPGLEAQARNSMQKYCQYAQLHSDPYPYKLLRARKFIEDLGGDADQLQDCDLAINAPVGPR